MLSLSLFVNCNIEQFVLWAVGSKIYTSYFQGLDYVIVEARKYRIRLILSLVNNLDAFGGKAQYVRWAQEAGINVPSNDSFFSDPVIKGYYKSYVKVCAEPF